MKLDKYDIAMVNACTRDERPVLQNLHLVKGRIEATDGFMLVIRDADITETEKDIETLIPSSILKTVKTTPKRQAILSLDTDSLTISHINEKEQPVDYDPKLVFKTYQPGINSKYPNIPALYEPIKTEKKAYIAVGVGLLKKLLATMPNGGILRIGITEPTEPLEFECSNMDRPIRGMLMPMFIDWRDFKWHRDEEKQEKKKEDKSNGRD